MKTYVIEREIPGASQLTHEELRGITSTSNDAVASLGKPYKWLHSYVAGDKVYCFHQAENAEVIREHARRRRLPRQPRRPRSPRCSTAPGRGTSPARRSTGSPGRQGRASPPARDLQRRRLRLAR